MYSDFCPLMDWYGCGQCLPFKGHSDREMYWSVSYVCLSTTSHKREVRTCWTLVRCSAQKFLLGISMIAIKIGSCSVQLWKKKLCGQHSRFSYLYNIYEVLSSSDSFLDIFIAPCNKIPLSNYWCECTNY